MSGKPWRLFMLGALLAAFMMTTVTSAYGASPTLTQVKPDSGSRFTGGFAVSFCASDPDGVSGAAARVTIGTKTYTPAVNYAGTWVGDGCDTWWVDDTRTAYFNLNVPDPGPGVFDVTITVPDALGEVATTTFTITRTAALNFSEQSPKPGARLKSVTDLAVLVSGSAISTSSAVVTVDGAMVPSTCQMIGSGAAIVTASYPFLAGGHTVSIAVGDGTSAPPATTTWTFIVDSAASPPLVGTATPVEGSIVQGAFQLSYHVTDANGVNGAGARVLVDGRQLYSGITSYAGYWTGNGCDTWWQEDRTSADIAFAIPNLPSGPHTFRLEVPDDTGDDVVTTTTLLRSLDLTASGQTPTNDSRNTSVDRVSVSLNGAVIDQATVSMTIDGALVPAVFMPAAAGGVVSYGAPLAEGRHTVRVSASDALGSPPYVEQWSFMVDSTAPRVSSLLPSADATVTLADSGIDVSVEETDAIDTSTIRLTLDGSPLDTTFTANSTGGTIRWNGIFSEGAHTSTLVARDLAGNEASRTWSFFVANPPTFGAIAPTAIVAETATITAEVSDVNDELDPAVHVTLDGAEVSATLVPTGAKQGRVEAAVAGLANGSHTVVASVRDSAHNEVTKTWSFTADTLPPALTAKSPDSGTVFGSHTVPVSATLTDVAGMDPSTAKGWIDGTPVSVSAYNDSYWAGSGCDTWEVPVPQTLFVKGDCQLHDGSHTFRVAATDYLGHTSSSEWSFTVQEKPSITQLAPAPKGRSTSTSMTVSANVTDFDGVAKTSVAWREANIGSTPGTWTPLSASYDAGTNQLSAHFAFPRADVRYEFRFTGTDVGGLSTNAITDVFASSSAKQIGVSVDCGACHTTILKTHPMSNCTACHGDPRGPCSCHSTAMHGTDLLQSATISEHGSTWTGRTCTDCHGHTADVTAQQHSSEIDGSCAICHKNALTAEHATKSVNGSEFTCETCHTSTSTSVKAAIANHDASCPACHATYHADVLGKHTAPPESTCQSAGCHAPGPIDDLHAAFVGAGKRYPEYATSCDLCHANKNAARIPVGATANCFTCHGDVGAGTGHKAIHEATIGSLMAVDSHNGLTSIAPLRCVTCHLSANLITLHADDCSVCHSSGGPRSSFTRWAKGCQQGACHPSVHAEASWGHVDDRDCEDCHNIDYSVRCLDCHLHGPDTVAPITSSDARSIYIHPASEPAVIHFAVSDNAGPSVRRTYYRLDGSATSTVVNGAVSVPAPSSGIKEHDLEFWSEDWSRNVEQPHKTMHFRIIVDTKAPQTTSNAKALYVGPATIKFTATDNSPDFGVRATYYQVDDGAVTIGNSLTIPRPSSTVTHTVYFWSVDVAGNVEPRNRVDFTQLP